MPSAAFTVNGASNPGEHTAPFSSTVNLALVSTNGVNTITWSILACSKLGAPLPEVTVGGSPSGATASFELPGDPGDGDGRAYLVECAVSTSGGNALRETAVVGRVNAAGLLPLVPGEEAERSSTHWWGETVNRALKAAGAALPTPADPGDDGKILVSDGGEYVLGDQNIDPADPGGEGELVYNGTGVYLASSGVTYTGFGLKLSNEYGLQWDHTTSGVITGMYVGAGNILYIGVNPGAEPSAIQLNIATGGTLKVRVNGTEEFEVSATAIDCKSNNVTNVGSLTAATATATTALLAGSATAYASVGQLRFASGDATARTLAAVRNNTNSADTSVISVGTSGQITFGDNSKNSILNGSDVRVAIGGSDRVIVQSSLVQIEAATMRLAVSGTKVEANATGVAFNGATPAARPDYTITNPSTQRSLDVSTTDLGAVAATLGTLIQDLITIGLLQ